MKTRWMSCAETARLVRKALKETFPGVKFSVRSKTYSGGASIDVGWTDGPTYKQVEAVTSQFEGADFDSMVDCKYYCTHWLMPDGSVSLAKSSGAHGFDVEKFPAPSPDAQRVSMGADFIFTNRDESPEFTRKVGMAYATETGWEMPDIYPTGGFVCDFTKLTPGSNTPLADWFNRKLWATSA